jgi:PqqD family protein of HPr-rel-A system
MTKPIEMNAVPIRRGTLRCHELDGEAVLYDPAHHAVHYLNATAYLIWQHCDGERNAQELLGDLARQFDCDGHPADLQPQILAALAHLVENGLVDWGQLQAA